MPTDAIQCKPLEVAVGDKGIERAIKHLKRKMAARAFCASSSVAGTT